MKTIRISASVALLAATSLSLVGAILVQPHNYMLDDSALVGQPDGGSLAPFYNDQGGEQTADKDIVGIISERLARLRDSRALEQQEAEGQQQQNEGLSAEMAELIRAETASEKEQSGQEQSLAGAVAGALLGAAQAAAEEAAQSAEQPAVESLGARAIMELDTSSAQGSAQPSKADLKGNAQWFNPKETIPVLKISSMATPSKYKKVYFRSEKKLVDGAFHSPGSEQAEKKTLAKSFGSGVQRRSSRVTAPVSRPGVIHDGLDFLKKFRDVYVQTRPVAASSAPSSSPSAFNLASLMSAAASSPLASVLTPPAGSRPNLVGALSAASSMVSAASAPSVSSPAASAAATAAGKPGKSPLTAQSYVSFWSKTFPTWVRKMLKQLRRRSLHNSSKRHQHQHSQGSALGQAAQAAAASVVEQATNGSSQSQSNGSSSS